MTQFYRDFSEYSTGAIGTVGAADWSVQSTTGDWTHNITTDGAATGGQTHVMNRTFAGDGSQIDVFDASSTTGDLECVVRVKHNVAIANNNPNGAALVNTADNQAYAVYFTDDTTVGLARFSTGGSVSTPIGTAAFNKPALDTYYWVRIGRSGTAIRMKAWADGDSEPGSWMVSAANTTLTTVKAGLYVRAFGSAPHTFDVFGVGTGGDAASSSPPGGGSFQSAWARGSNVLL